MAELTVKEATENVYASLHADNADIDDQIAALRLALAKEGVKEAVFEPSRLAQNNRSGRKTMQAYFRKHGVTVTFAAE